jgi:hypothetical protein
VNRNDEAQGMAVAIAFIGMALFFAAAFVFAVAAFLAAVFTVLALCAWFKPITLMGETIHPHEARAFVKRGVIGVFALPAFAVFAAILLGCRIPEDVFPYLFIGGYVAGSIGVQYLIEQGKQNAPHTLPPVVPTPPTVSGPPAPRSLPRSPFEFASWDDEDKKP